MAVKPVKRTLKCWLLVQNYEFKRKIRQFNE